MNKMKNVSLVFALIFLGLAPWRSAAQHVDHGVHGHSRNEIGVSGGAVYAVDHKEWGTGVHLHYFRTLSEENKWSLGAVAEYVWVHGGHTTVGAGVKYQLTPKLSFGVLPGVTFLKHDHEEDHMGEHGDHGNETRFSAHVELVYDLFHWEDFHLGPVLDFSFSRADSHGMIGLHAAYCF